MMMKTEMMINLVQKGKWATPVIVSILVIGLLYSVDTQTADAHSVCGIFSPSGSICDDANVCTIDSCELSVTIVPGPPPSVTFHDHCDFDSTGVTVSCRAASNDCDVEEFCDGAGSCPADALEPAGTVCGIPADGVKLNCDGTGICVTTNVVTCGLGTTLNPTTLVCEANICVDVDDDDDEDDDEDEDDDDDDEGDDDDDDDDEDEDD